jgi:hypothetical protein
VKIIGFKWIYFTVYGPGSVVGIATGYELDGPGIESRWGSRFSAPVQTGPGAHPASCTIGIGSFPGVKSGQGVTLTPYPFYCSGQERVEPYGLYRASVPVQVRTLHLLYFTVSVKRFCRHSHIYSFLGIAGRNKC